LTVLRILEALLLVPVAGGAVYLFLDVLAVMRFRRRLLWPAPDSWPPASILKPLYGADKNLGENLRSVCRQDYPEYEVVLSLQRKDDPALPVAREIQQEFGPERVRVVVGDVNLGGNGKINNLLGSYASVRHEVLVISDSDVRLPPGYLKAIIAPLADPTVGCVCTPYRAAEAQRWFEKLELLTLNADFTPSVIFASETGASSFGLGASMALRKSTLQEIGGLESFANQLVEDFEMARRIAALGMRAALAPFFIDTMVDLKSPGDWWAHQVYWDQNTRIANPAGLFGTIFIRSVPFSLFYAAVRLFDPLGLLVLAGTVAIRLLTAGAIMRLGLGDREGIRALPWLPLRDLAGLASWFLAFTKRSVRWRGTDFLLGRGGRLIPKTTYPPETNE
jgi:ceramide glucosyltransferase